MTAYVIAMESEAKCVLDHMTETLESLEFGRRVVSGKLHGERVLVVVSGVGKANAAAATQFAIGSGADEIRNVGVAGGFEEGMKVGDLYEVDCAVQYDFDLSAVNGTEKGTLNERETPYFPLARDGKYPAKTLGTGDRFTESEADFPLFRRLGVGLRDMEGAAIAQVCERCGVPLYSLKCVSNVIGSGATGQYAAHLAGCLKTLTAALA